MPRKADLLVGTPRPYRARSVGGSVDHHGPMPCTLPRMQKRWQFYAMSAPEGPAAV